MEIHLKLVGIILIGIALIHVGFPKKFKWKEELSSLSLINQQMMVVHTFFVALTVVMIGFLCLYSTDDLINTDLGRQICFGLFIFWFIRFIFQFFVYSTKLWMGKLFETTMHIIFSLIWLYVSLVFLFIVI